MINIDTRPFFPKDNTIVDYNPDLFLLHTHYSRSLDTLFNIYIDQKTGKSKLEKREHPEVPIFIARKTPKYNQEYIKRDATDRYMIPYISKNKATRELLFEGKRIYYKDEWGNEYQKILMPHVPRKAEYLHPGVFMLDVPIEQWAYMEKFKPHYQYHEEDGVVDANITIPDIHYASFDIETSKANDGTWYINMNTFVDEFQKKAYIDFPVFKDGRYKRQDELINNKEKFVEDLKKTFKECVDNLELKANEKTIKMVKTTCNEFIDSLDVIVREFKDEATFIRETTKTMFTDHKPHILMAFNTTYDIGVFQERIDALGLPKGTFNERGIGYDDIEPPFSNDDNRDYIDKSRFKGDTFNPTQRRVYLNNISHTMISDFQTCFYSSRRGANYSTFGLEDTANRIIGFGKLDYSDICNNILYLPFEDFWTHAKYAIIDSILLIICNKIGSEFFMKLAFVQMTKTNIEESPSPNVAVSRMYQNDAAVLESVLPGININKILISMKLEDVKKCSDLLKVDYTKQKRTLTYSGSYGGGLVADPLLKRLTDDVMKCFPILKGEANVVTFMKFLNVLYLDLKSHYPFTIYTRNLARLTLVGLINMIIEKSTNTVVKYSGYMKGLSPKNKVDNFGGVNVALINRDIISYGALCNNLPDLNKLIPSFINFDSEPKIGNEPDTKFSFRMSDKVKKDYNKLRSILSSCNRLKIGNQEEKYMHKDAKHYFFTDGEMSFNNSSLVKFTYRGPNLLELLLEDTSNLDAFVDINDSWYGYTKKDEVFLQTSGNFKPPRNKAFEFDDNIPWINVSEEELSKLAEAEVFPVNFMISEKDNVFIRTVNRSFYFPFKAWQKQIEDAKVGKGTSKKEPEITTPMVRYQKLDKTTKLQFNYTIYKEGIINLDIDIYMQIINLKEE